MALVKCPECGREVSERAAACPNCGFPISEEFQKKIAVQSVASTIKASIPTEPPKEKAANVLAPFYLFSYSGNKVNVECGNCGKIYIYDKKFFSSTSSSKCVPNTKIQCKNCGNECEPLTHIVVKGAPVSTKDVPDSSVPHCPKCGSTSIQLSKAGFSAGDAAFGALLLGPLGLLGGALGSNEVYRVCLNCKHKF